MSYELAKAHVSIQADTAQFGQSLNKAKGILSRSLASMRGMVGAAMAGIGGTMAARWAINLAVAAEQAEISFGVIIKDVQKTKALLKDIEEFSILTPYTPAEVREAAKMLLAFGVSVDDVKDTLQVLGDIASGTGSNLLELVSVFTQIKGEGKLMLQDYRQLAMRGANLQQPLMKVLKVTEEQFKKMRSEGKITFADTVRGLEMMTAKGGMFFQGMEKQSKSLAGLWSTLQGDIESITATLVTQFLPAMKDVTTAVDELLKWATGGSSPIANWWKDAQVGVGTVINYIASAWQLMMKQLENSIVQVASNFDVSFSMAIDEIREKLAMFWDEVTHPWSGRARTQQEIVGQGIRAAEKMPEGNEWEKRAKANTLLKLQNELLDLEAKKLEKYSPLLKRAYDARRRNEAIGKQLQTLWDEISGQMLDKVWGKGGKPAAPPAVPQVGKPFVNKLFEEIGRLMGPILGVDPNKFVGPIFRVREPWDKKDSVWGRGMGFTDLNDTMQQALLEDNPVEKTNEILMDHTALFNRMGIALGQMDQKIAGAIVTGMRSVLGGLGNLGRANE